MTLLGPRRLATELMDDPSLDEREHRRALRALACLNALSRADRPVWTAILPLLRQTTPLHLLDIATGSADVPIRLAARARAAGFDLRIAGCDMSPVAIDAARRRAAAADVDAHFFVGDAIHHEVRAEADVVMSSLFMHHLPEPEIEVLLRRMAGLARSLVVVADLRRTALGLALAAAASRLSTRSHVVHKDAVLSARGALTIPEFGAIARDAGLDDARIVPTWPSRMRLTWSPRPA